MSIDTVLAVGLIVLLFGGILHLRHLASGIAKHFHDCVNLRQVFQKSMELDEVTAAGILFFFILAIAAVLTAVTEIVHAIGGKTGII